jgi:dTMP kinase
MNEVATHGVTPDLTILLDIEPAAGLQRAHAAVGKEGRRGRGDRFEQEALAFHARARAGFLAIAHEEPDRVRIVDGSRAQPVVHDEILRVVEGLLSARGWRASSSS